MNRLLPFLLLALACDPSRPTYQGPAESNCQPVLDASIEYLASVSCRPSRCRPSFVQSACDFSLTLEDCDLAPLVASVDAVGALTFVRAEELGTCEASHDGASLQLLCNRGEAACAIDIVPKEPERPLQIDRVELHNVPFLAPSGSKIQRLDYDDALEGYAVSIVVVGDDIVVSTYGGDNRTTRCSASVESRLVFVDRESLQTRTATAPRCLSFMAEDPAGPGFIGLFDDGTPSIGRFSPTGSLIAQAAIPVVPERTASRPSAFAADPVARVIYVAYDHEDDPIVRLDAVTLETTTVSYALFGRVRGLTLADQSLVATERVDGIVYVLDPNTLVQQRAIPMVQALRPSDDAGDVYWSASQRRLFVSATGNESVVWVLDSPIAIGTAPRFIVELNLGATVWGFVPPIEPGPDWAFGVGDDPAYDAWLFELDADGPRFAPRATPIGRGVATDVLVDGDTRWVLMGWTAELLRIRRRTQ